MRAVCDQCERPQPGDWVAGDLCVHCGEAVRHELRCAWCAKWTPEAKFCRECGGEVVDETLYGAARMLKSAGVDRFTIPAQLASLDPAQVDNFSRIYQRHAIVVARHVDQLTFVQRFLRQGHWSAELEDRLVPDLPWDDDDLARYSSSPVELVGSTPAECVATLRAIEESSPIETTCALAAVARLRLDDWASLSAARTAFDAADSTVRDEAALALTSWRVRVGADVLDLDRDVVDALGGSRFPLEAGVRLAALTRGAEVPTDALTSPDPETSLGAALVLGDIDRLEAALHGDAIEAAAAGAALARLGIPDRLGPVLSERDDATRRRVLEALSLAKRPVPDLTGTLMQLIEATDDPSLRELAVRVAAPTISGREARRIVEVVDGETRTVQSLLQRSTLAGDDMAGVLDSLIALGRFTAGQFGVSTIVEEGRLADTYVPSRFPEAAFDVQTELLALAKLQLGQRNDATLHRFVLQVVFGPIGGERRTGAWWVLHRGQRDGGDSGDGPLRLTVESIGESFGTIDEFLPRLALVMCDAVALDDPTFGDFLADLLGSFDAEFIAAVQQRDRVGLELVESLIASMPLARFNTAEAVFTLLSRLGTYLPWREQALVVLQRLDHVGNYHFDKAVRRLTLAEFGIPSEDEWNALPVDFVPERFADVSDAGRAHLLEVAEFQLIHGPPDEPDEDLLAFLAAVGDGSSVFAGRARQIHDERAPRHTPSFDRPD